MIKGQWTSCKRAKIRDKEDKCETLTQQVFGAVCVVVVVIREMVDSVTAALIDACKTETTRKTHVMFRRGPFNQQKGSRIYA